MEGRFFCLGAQFYSGQSGTGAAAWQGSCFWMNYLMIIEEYIIQCLNYLYRE